MCLFASKMVNITGDPKDEAYYTWDVYLSWSPFQSVVFNGWVEPSVSLLHIKIDFNLQRPRRRRVECAPHAPSPRRPGAWLPSAPPPWSSPPAPSPSRDSAAGLHSRWCESAAPGQKMTNSRHLKLFPTGHFSNCRTKKKRIVWIEWKHSTYDTLLKYKQWSFLQLNCIHFLLKIKNITLIYTQKRGLFWDHKGKLALHWNLLSNGEHRGVQFFPLFDVSLHIASRGVNRQALWTWSVDKINPR